MRKLFAILAILATMATVLVGPGSTPAGAQSATVASERVIENCVRRAHVAAVRDYRLHVIRQTWGINSSQYRVYVTNYVVPAQRAYMGLWDQPVLLGSTFVYARCYDLMDRRVGVARHYCLVLRWLPDSDSRQLSLGQYLRCVLRPDFVWTRPSQNR